MTRLPLVIAALLTLPLPALAAPAPAADGYVVCVGVDTSAQGRVVQTAEPYRGERERADADATAFSRAAATQGKAGPALQPACHWEPTRDKAADYLRRFKEGVGKKGAEAQTVAFAPG